MIKSFLIYQPKTCVVGTHWNSSKIYEQAQEISAQSRQNLRCSHKLNIGMYMRAQERLWMRATQPETNVSSMLTTPVDNIPTPNVCRCTPLSGFP